MLDTHTIFRERTDDPPAPLLGDATTPSRTTTTKPIVRPINRRMVDWFAPIFWFVLAALAFALTTFSTATQTSAPSIPPAGQSASAPAQARGTEDGSPDLVTTSVTVLLAAGGLALLVRVLVAS